MSFINKIGTHMKKVREQRIAERNKIKRVREAIEHKQLEKEAEPIVAKTGVSLEEAVAYIKAKKKQQHRAEQVRRFRSRAGELSRASTKIATTNVIGAQKKELNLDLPKTTQKTTKRRLKLL